MALFTSEYPFKVDRKGRISVPADYRTVLSQESYPGIVLIPVRGALALDGFGSGRLESLSEALDDPDIYDDEEELEQAKQLFAEARRLPFDGDGRIVLPEEIRNHAEIDGTAIYVGGGSTFRLWNPDAYAAHKAKLNQSATAKGQSIRLRLAPKKKKRVEG